MSDSIADQSISAVIILGVLYWFGKSHKSRAEWASIFVRVIIGLGLALLSTMYDANSDPFFNFVQSPWVLPTVALVFGLVILIDNLLVWYSNKQITRHDTEEREASDSA